MMDDAAAVEKMTADAKLKTSVFKCPNCGGEAEFDAKTQKLHCLYCGGYYEIQNNEKVTENELSELLDKATVWNEAEVYECKSCGAKEILDKQEVATVCPFCGTNNVVRTEDLPGIKPQGVVTFKIEKSNASDIAKAWAKKDWFAPNDFKRSATTENIHGVYNPVFTFDAETKSDYDGRLGKYYTVRRGKHTYTEVRYFHISGKDYPLNFDDFIVQASTSVPQKHISKISPFPTNGAPVFKSEYLRGFSANAYNKDGKVCWDECKELMRIEIEKRILSKYNYDVKSYVNISTKFNHPLYKYILVPLYIGNYRYKEKIFNFFINGSNGKISGSRPKSFWKILFATILGLIVAGLIIYLMFLGDFVD
ncbi:MAG: hypothetical protein IKQ31_00910 [Clostridia bacterium]|nr:hypothetical protein [Clostridia bacterium]